MVAIEKNAEKIWYYYKDKWNYYSTLDKASELLCDGGCFVNNNEQICTSPVIDITGSVGYSILGSKLTLSAENIENNTQQDCISETLELTLWAQPDDTHYYELGSTELGQLESNFYFYDVELETDLNTNIPDGNYSVTLNVVSKSKKNSSLDSRKFDNKINISNGDISVLNTTSGQGGSGGASNGSSYDWTYSCPGGYGGGGSAAIPSGSCETQYKQFGKVFGCNLVDEMYSACANLYNCLGETEHAEQCIAYKR